MKVTVFLSHDWKPPSVRWMHDSIISQAINFNRCSKCSRNSSSGQCKSRINDCNASSFQNRSSDVAHPLPLLSHRSFSKPLWIDWAIDDSMRSTYLTTNGANVSRKCWWKRPFFRLSRNVQGAAAAASNKIEFAFCGSNKAKLMKQYNWR